MLWFSVMLLAIAVSFDTLAMGITYGINRIDIPSWSKALLSLISGSTLFFAMLGGSILQRQLNPRFTSLLGGLVFIALGLSNLTRRHKTQTIEILINWRIPFLGLIVQVFREPLKADVDQSKHITSSEALVLGLALALDSIAAGFGAAVLALPLFATTIAVTLASFLFIDIGLKIGGHLALASRLQNNWHWVSGTIMLLLGTSKLLF